MKRFLSDNAPALLICCALLLCAFIYSCQNRYYVHTFRGNSVVFDRWTGKAKR